MTRRRWIADEVSRDRAAILGDHARHLAKVLRAQLGQEFDISTGSDVRLGRISSIQPDRVEFELGDPVHAAPPSPITAVISIFKFDRMEWAIEKCTELGVARIIPMIAARTESHLASSAQKRVERWRRIAKQASEQSRRTVPPQISAPARLPEVLAQAGQFRVVLSEVEEDRRLEDAISVASAAVVLAFGPEGGWTNRELKSFGDAGWQEASLGPTVLRAETAIVAALAICRSVLRTRSGHQPTSTDES